MQAVAQGSDEIQEACGSLLFLKNKNTFILNESFVFMFVQADDAGPGNKEAAERGKDEEWLYINN